VRRSNEFYQIAFRRKIYRSIEKLQVDLDEWLAYLLQQRSHAPGKGVLRQDTDANSVGREGGVAR